MSLSDPLRAPGKTPRRAEPLQPDRPGSGDGQAEDRDDSTRSPESEREATKRRIEQSETALDNVKNP